MANATSSSSPAVHRERRWFQFSLRTLLVAVVLIGFGSAWLGVKVQKAREQKAAVDAILNSGGSVTYDYESDSQGNHVPEPAASYGTKWLRPLLGIDFFQSVNVVTYSGNHCVVAADLERLKDLPDLKTFAMLGHQVAPDVAFKPLADLTQLQVLCICDPALTDAGMEFLKKLSRLRILQLRAMGVTDAGLECLKDLGQLEVLDLGGSPVAGAGLDQLKGLGQLKDLELSSTAVTDVGLRHLANLPQLEVLDVREHVTSAELEHINGLKRLSVLTQCCMGDDDIPHLAVLTKLKKLTIYHDLMTHAGNAKLQKALPNCSIMALPVDRMDSPEDEDHYELQSLQKDRINWRDLF
jgi:hypothetical protein